MAHKRRVICSSEPQSARTMSGDSPLSSSETWKINQPMVGEAKCLYAVYPSDHSVIAYLWSIRYTTASLKMSVGWFTIRPLSLRGRTSAIPRQLPSLHLDHVTKVVGLSRECQLRSCNITILAFYCEGESGVRREIAVQASPQDH